MVNEHMRDGHWGINPPSKDTLDTAETPRPGVTDYRVAVYRVTAYRVTVYRSSRASDWVEELQATSEYLQSHIM